MINPPAHPTFREAFWVWCRIAALSFGGPTAQIAVMHRVLVEEKKWISEHRFLHALNYCMLLPGPEAQQLAVYIGWLLHGTRGGLVAGTLFILPGFVAIMALSILYVYAQSGAHRLIAVIVAAILFGMRPAVAAIVAEAVLRIGKKILKNRLMVVVSVIAFIAIFFFELPFPLIIAAAGVTGLIGGHFWPQVFEVLHGAEHGSEEQRAVDTAAATKKVSLLRTLEVLAIWLTLWFAPLLLLRWYFGGDSVYVKEGVFFSKAAIVTFGGAYSVLSYIGQQAVSKYAWLKQHEMMDGLSMAETTPGPLIMVVQFVGFMGAYRNPGDLSPLAAGILGAVITVWVTFVPCFLWIFLGAPYIEKLRGIRLLNSALSTITAAVVGVILNLAIWFVIHTLFTDVREHHEPLIDLSRLWESPLPPGTTRIGAPSPFVFSFRWYEPKIGSLSKGSLVILLVAATLTFRFKRGLFVVLGLSVLFGVLLYVAGVL